MPQQLKATNEFVFIIRDKTELEKNGMLLASQSRVKPHQGTIKSVGELVKDPKIKSGKEKKCLFHATVGFPIEFEGIEYLVLMGHEIIAVIHDTGK